MRKSELEQNKRFTMAIVLILFAVGIFATFFIRDMRAREVREYMSKLSVSSKSSSSSSTVASPKIDKTQLQSKLKAVNDILSQVDEESSELDITLSL